MPTTLYSCWRIYNNGHIVKFTDASQSSMLEWIAFNKQGRPGCALLVNAEVKHHGYISDERLIDYCVRMAKEMNSKTK